jgi:alkylation response protein AidB-like acyl-CoA dehydrogenase
MSELLSSEELRETIRDVLAARSGVAIEIPGDEGRGFDRPLWQEMAALGWLGLVVPEAHGGLELGTEHLGVLYEELGRVLASVPILSTMIAASSIAAYADEDSKQKWLPAIASGDIVAALALPSSEAAAVLGPGKTIDGALDHVLFGDVADLLLFPVRVANGSHLVVLPATAPGVTVLKRPAVDLTRTLARIEIHEVPRLSATFLPLSEEASDALLDHVAMGLAAESVGAAAALLERTIDYLQLREQFGRPLGSFQALKHRLADWKVEIEATTVLSRYAATLLGSEDATRSSIASAAKAYACDTFAAFAGDAIQLHGGIGFTWEHPCHLFLKRAKLSQQLYGNSTAHKERVARLRFDVEQAEDARSMRRQA